MCRAYINPFVSFVDARHWRCNVCFRNNIGKSVAIYFKIHLLFYICYNIYFIISVLVPDDYDINPHTGKRGDRSHHAELRYPSIEYIAPSEYMVCTG